MCSQNLLLFRFLLAASTALRIVLFFLLIVISLQAVVLLEIGELLHIDLEAIFLEVLLEILRTG